MLSTSPLAEPEAGRDAITLPPSSPQGDPSIKPYDLDTEIPAASEPSAPQASGEFVMGPRQMASLAFVGILVLGIMSAVAYFAGRGNTAPAKVTERVIERVVQAPSATPAPAIVAAAAAPPKPAEATTPVAVNKPTAAPGPKAEVTAPILNRLYLQAGSVEVGIAEVMVEGLRHRGIPAIVGIGINAKVARVLVGPFSSPEEQRDLLKKVEDMGFHPYPRSFSAKDLEQQQIKPADQVKPPEPAKQTPPLKP